MRSINHILPHKCDFGKCGVAFITPEKLEQHMKRHDLNGEYNCPKCNYKTNTIAHLNRHIIHHTGENPFKCDHKDCFKAFSNNDDLTKHYRIHIGIKPYKCSQCSYETSFSCDLKKHILGHSNIRPYKCSQCNYTTVIARYLSDHINTHTGEKPYKCAKCDYKSGNSNSLRSHIQRNHLAKEAHTAETAKKQ